MARPTKNTEAGMKKQQATKQALADRTTGYEKRGERKPKYVYANPYFQPVGPLQSERTEEGSDSNVAWYSV